MQSSLIDKLKNSDYINQMIFRTRSGSFTFYRVFFIGLFLLLGIVGIGSVLLENYANIRFFNVGTEFDNHALKVTFVVMGFLSMATAFMMIFLLREKRCKTGDRRQRFEPVNFTDRRTNTDRRAKI